MSWFRGKRAREARKALEAEEAAKLVAAVIDDDHADRVQAAMLGKEHEAVAEIEKQAKAPYLVLGPEKKTP